MPVRIADTIESMNPSFPAMMGSSLNININGLEKSLQNAINDGDLSGGGSSIQTDVMPIPSSEYEDKIVQYIGESGTYKNGYFYKCQAVEGSSPTQYEWVEQEVQESKDSTPHWSGTRSEYEEVKDTLEVGTYVSITDDYEDEVIQWSVMPDANSDYLEKIVQYVGETNDDYTNGYFYECCVVEGSDPYVYEWKAKEVQKSTVSKSVFYSDVIEEVIDYKVGEVFCYTSDDEGKFKKGHFYKKETRSDWLYAGMVTSIAKRFYFESQDMKQGEYVYVETPSNDGVYVCYVIAYSYTNNDDTVVGLKNLHTSDTSEYTISYTTKSYMSNIFDWIDINGCSIKYLDSKPAKKDIENSVYGIYIDIPDTVWHTIPDDATWVEYDRIYDNFCMVTGYIPSMEVQTRAMKEACECVAIRGSERFDLEEIYTDVRSTSSGGDRKIKYFVPKNGYRREVQEGDVFEYKGSLKELRYYAGDSAKQELNEMGQGSGGSSIFYGTMDEWNALSADEKKQYEYMADDDEGGGGSVTGVITRNTSNTSGMQEAYLKRIGKTVMLHCILMDCVLPANEITTYASVPDGFRPDSSLQWTMLDLDFSVEGLRGWITNSGSIQLLSPVATTSSIRIQSMYFTD